MRPHGSASEKYLAVVKGSALAKRLSRSRKEGSSKKAFRRGLKRVLKLFCLLMVFTVLQVLILKMVDPPVTTGMAFQWVKIKLGMDDGSMPR